MPVRLVEPASAAYEYPLLVKHLLHTALATAPRQDIVYSDLRRPDWVDRLTAHSIRVHVAAAVETGALPKYAVPEHVTFLATLDKASVGKTDKRLLRDRYC